MKGLFTDAPVPYEGAGRTVLRTIDVDTAGLELRYGVFPPFDLTALDIADGFRASAVAVDILFDDGSRLLDSPVVDQYGLPADARGSFERHALSPDQWNLRRIDLGPASRRAVALEIVSETALAGWLDAIDIVTPHRLDRTLRPSELVDTRRGSNSSPYLSRGNTAPFVATPHGAVFATPMTDVSNPHWNYAWNQHGDTRKPSLAALAISHSASIWIGDWGVVLFTPHGDGMFDHENETALPHRYAVELDSGVTAQAEPTSHGVVLRFTFPAGSGAIDLGSFGPAEFAWADGVLSGWVDGSSVHGHVIPRMFFSATTEGVTALTGTTLATTDSVELRIGTSLISRENAALAVPGSLDAQSEWDELLGRVTVKGATDDQLVTLYSNLYRMYLYPNRLGEAMPDGTVAHISPATGAVVPGELSANNGFWDTYRTIWPALVLLRPDAAAHLLDGFVQHYREGGWVPRWSAPGSLDAMVGTSFDIVFADAAAKGAVDPETGYRAALRDATARPAHPADGRKGLASSLYRGYVDRTVPEGLSWTVEGALNDFGLSVLAGRLGHTAEQRYFASRAFAHESLFDAATGFFRGREANGQFGADFEPFRWGGDYTETSAWTMAFAAPHDGAGLARMHDLRARLDEYFTIPETGREQFRGDYPTVIHEMVEARDLRMGLWGLSNQPAHHIPFLYAHAGDPASMQRIVAEARRRLFTGSEIGQGYPGDEDNGEMSAWWFFAALGLYPLTPGAAEYVVCGPLFPRMTVALPHGTLDVIAHGSGDYVQSLLVDGEPWEHITVPHSRIARGARLEFVLGPEPSDWGRDSRPFSHTGERLVDASPRARASVPALVDDIGETSVALDEITWEFDSPTTPLLYTITFESPGSHSWRLEASDDGERWSALDDRTVATEWPLQLRPFEIALPRAGRWFRLVGDGTRVVQVELLEAAPEP